MSTITEKNITIDKRVKMKVMCESYRSASEVVADCEKRNITDSNFEDVKSQTNWKWRGVKSYEDAMDLMKHGYQPTVDKLKEQLKISRQGTGKRISFENNIVGANPIVPLAMMGVPNCMIDMKMKPIKCKVIDVYYDMTMSCMVGPEEIIANGQKLLGVILELERSGYRFNLYGVQTYSDDGDVDMLAVKVKSASQPIDLKRMSFPLTHVGFFRVIGFDWYSKTPRGKYRGGYGRGLGYRLDEKQIKVFAKSMFGDNAIYISAAKMSEKDSEHLKGVLTNEKCND